MGLLVSVVALLNILRGESRSSLDFRAASPAQSSCGLSLHWEAHPHVFLQFLLALKYLLPNKKFPSHIRISLLRHFNRSQKQVWHMPNPWTFASRHFNAGIWSFVALPLHLPNFILTKRPSWSHPQREHVRQLDIRHLLTFHVKVIRGPSDGRAIMIAKRAYKSIPLEFLHYGQAKRRGKVRPSNKKELERKGGSRALGENVTRNSLLKNLRRSLEEHVRWTLFLLSSSKRAQLQASWWAVEQP